MEFAFTEEQAMIAETARAFFADNATSERTRRAMAADGIDRDLWQSFCTELGLAGIGVPEDGQAAELLPAGSYACRPAHVLHGPFFTESGCLMIEFNYYPPTLPTRQERLP